MYRPERFNETIGETIRGAQSLAHEIYPYFLPHKPDEIFQGPSKLYRPRTFEGILRNQRNLRMGKVVMPRETRLQQKYRQELDDLQEEERTSPDGLNRFTRRIKEEVKKKGVIIERNWYPYRIPHNKCMQFSVWYDQDTSVYQRAEYVAVAIYTDGLEKSDAAMWENIPRNKSVPSIGHLQLIIKRYPENWFTLFQHLPVHFMHGDIYDYEQPADHIYPLVRSV